MWELSRQHSIDLVDQKITWKTVKKNEDEIKIKKKNKMEKKNKKKKGMNEKNGELN